MAYEFLTKSQQAQASNQEAANQILEYSNNLTLISKSTLKLGEQLQVIANERSNVYPH